MSRKLSLPKDVQTQTLQVYVASIPWGVYVTNKAYRKINTLLLEFFSAPNTSDNEKVD